MYDIVQDAQHKVRKKQIIRVFPVILLLRTRKWVLERRRENERASTEAPVGGEGGGGEGGLHLFVC